MSAAARAAEQFYQIETLADYALVGVESVIRDDDKRGFRGHWTSFNRCPDAAHHCVEFAQHLQMRIAIVIVMGGVIKGHRHQIQIAYARVVQFRFQFAFGLIEDDVADFKAAHEFLGQSRRMFQEMLLTGVLQGGEPWAPLI